MLCQQSREMAMFSLLMEQIGTLEVGAGFMGIIVALSTF
jgi:hypothetical protein